MPLFDSITYKYNNSFRNQRAYKDIIPNDDLDIIIEEFQNPFDARVVSLINELESQSSISKEQNYFHLSVIDSLVREVLILFTLGEEQPIYFLVNTYKIMENLKNEYNLGINSSRLTKKKDSKPIPDYLFDSLGNLYMYSRYINSRDAAGIFSRHGATNVEPPLIKPTFKEIRMALITSINFWLNHKCELIFERSHI